MAAQDLHEPAELLSIESQNLHRAMRSLIEEIEAADWYTQRAEATSDEELRAILLHHRDEEVEHAVMLLEWLRRRLPIFADQLATRLGRAGPIAVDPPDGVGAEATTQGAPSLGIGSLRKSA